MKIKVTRKHIEQGERLETRSCPIALAFKDLGWGSVQVYTLKVYKKKKGKKYLLPSSAIKFITKFDEGKTVRPFTFELDTN